MPMRRQSETGQHGLGPMSGYPWQILAVAFLMSIQALYLGFHVTPLGDIPDEVGHYSYVRDIANGEVFPLIGQAYMAPDLWGLPAELQRPESRKNHIVQHPPLYYLVAAIPLVAADWVTDDVQFLYRAPRLVSALALGGLILVLFQTLVSARIPRHRAMTVAPMVGLIPTVTYLASGTTNDIFLFFLSALATLYLVRFVMGRNLRDAYLCAFWLTLAGATKMTAWVAMVPMVGILLFEMRQPLWVWIRHAFGVVSTALLFPVLWMIRNAYHFGQPFYIAGSELERKVFDYGFTKLLRDEPVLDSLFAHFYGLVGFTGFCVSYDLREFCTGIQMTRLFLFPDAVFTDVMFLLVLGMVAYLVIVARKPGVPDPRIGPGTSIRDGLLWITANRWVRISIMGVFFLVGMGLTVFILTTSYLRDTPTGAMQLWTMALAPLIGVVSMGLVLLPQEARDRVALYGPVVFLFFGSVLLYQVYQGYLYNEWLRGVHGRYLYPVIPLLIVSAAIAFERLRVPTVVYLGIALVLALAFYDAFLGQVIPFYLSVRI
jgi:hypothetical protein